MCVTAIVWYDSSKYSMIGCDAGDEKRWGETANSHLHQAEQQGILGKANKNSMRLRCVRGFFFYMFQTVGGGRQIREGWKAGNDAERKNTTLSGYLTAGGNYRRERGGLRWFQWEMVNGCIAWRLFSHPSLCVRSYVQKSAPDINLYMHWDAKTTGYLSKPPFNQLLSKSLEGNNMLRKKPLKCVQVSVSICWQGYQVCVGGRERKWILGFFLPPPPSLSPLCSSTVWYVSDHQSQAQQEVRLEDRKDKKHAKYWTHRRKMCEIFSKFGHFSTLGYDLKLRRRNICTSKNVRRCKCVKNSLS